MSKKMVWQFLLELPHDKEEYVEWVEEIAHYRNVHICELTDAGYSEDAIFEMQIAWKQNLPNVVRKEFPKLTAVQVQNTIQLIFDCGYSFIYANDLFNSLEHAIKKSYGLPVYTEILDLYPHCDQLN